MFRSQQAVLFTAVIIYIAYLYGFSCIFELDYTLIFYILAVMMGIAFYALVSDYFPKTEVDKMRNPSSGSRCIADDAYTWASLAAIMMLLLSITPLLITIYLNQSDTYRVWWIFQGLIYLAGYALQFTTLAIYKRCDSISISGSARSSKMGQRASTSPVTTTDTMTRRRISYETYAEADKIIREILRDLTGVDDCEIKDTAWLYYDLGVDFFDFVEIELELEKRIDAKYGFSLWDIEHHYQESDVMKRYIDVRHSADADKLDFSKSDDVDLYGERLKGVLKTVGDCKELVAGLIHYVRYI